MAVEPRRRCGFRKIGGIYLEAGGPSAPCGRLPAPLDNCDRCSYMPPFTRGVQKVGARLALLHAPSCHRGTYDAAFDLMTGECQLCLLGGVSRALRLGQDRPESALNDQNLNRCALMWIGRGTYPTPTDFLDEARELGISRRLSAWPAWIVPGVTILLCAHAMGSHGAATGPDATSTQRAAIIAASLVTRIVQIVPDTMPEPESLALLAQGFHLVKVSHDDPDHRPDDDE